MPKRNHTANPVAVADAALPGWVFGDANAMAWQPIGERIALKMLGHADGKVIAMFKFDPGYAGGAHSHVESEFTFVMEGSVVSNGVLMKTGQCYAVGAGTEHAEFRSDEGSVVLSVFKAPG